MGEKGKRSTFSFEQPDRISIATTFGAADLLWYGLERANKLIADLEAGRDPGLERAMSLLRGGS